MQLNAISEKVNNLARSWEEFKSVNERRLDDLAKKKSADPLLDNQMRKISDDIDMQKSRLDNLEVIMNRPLIGQNSNNQDDHEYKQAFGDYLRKGADSKISDIESRSYLSSNDPDGGFLIRPAIASEIIKNIENNVMMRKLSSVQVISTDALDVIEDLDKLTSGWVHETQARNDTSSFKISKKRLPVYEMYAQPKATQKLVDDASIDIEKWLGEKLSQSFSLLEGESFINGDGANKPRGILSYSPEKMKHFDCKEIDADMLIKMYFSLNENYAGKASFLMNRMTLAKIRSLKCDKTGQYLWTPGLEKSSPDRLLGVPVYTDMFMPAEAKDKKVIALADFKSAYKIVDRVGIRVLRDPFTDKPFVKYYTTKRVGGDVVNPEAISILKLI